MKNWKKTRFSKDFMGKMKNQKFFEKINSWRIYQLTYSKKIDTWDYQWDYHCLESGKLSIISKKNLITNLGFQEGTHTTNYKESQKTIERKEIKFPLIENKKLVEDEDYYRQYSKFFMRDVFLNKLRKLFKKIIFFDN
jgi:hypothetical protein